MRGLKKAKERTLFHVLGTRG